MPNLKQINCSIELGPKNTQLKEYGHRYTDGGVEAFVAVPESDIPFQVHVASTGYIAPGLAAYLFIDGQYQCNRNRQRLQIPSPGMSPLEYEIDFKLRQREEKTSEGQFVAREWTFSKLQTANADLAPNTNPNFTKNVGTIEVVVLRCAGGDEAGSGEDLIDTTGAPTGPDVARPPNSPSVRRAIPAEKAATKAPSRAATNAPSRAASKVASRVASRAPSKQESEGGMLGGMMGLFDGAGDHPGYPSYTPRYSRDPQPSPGYQRGYRDDRYDPTPYRAPPRHAYEDAYDPRPRTAAGRYPPQSPMGGYGYEERHRPSPGLPPRMPGPRPIGRVIYPPDGQARYNSTPEGFSFIQELCQQIDNVMRLQFEETQKHNQLFEEAHKNRHDPDIHYAAMKAARGAEQALGSLQEECNALWASLISRMNRMDEAGWNFVRDYVVLERRLIPMSHPQFQQWRDPRYQQYTDSTPNTQSAQATAGRDQGWQEVGQGETGGGGLAARKRAEQDGWKRQDQGKSEWAQGAPVDEIDKQADARREERDKDKGNDGWGDDKKSNNGGRSQRSGKAKTDPWANNNDDNDKGNDPWDQKSRSKHSQSNRSRTKTQTWGNQDNGGGNNDNWGGGGDEGNKSQSAQSKTNGWNDGGGGGGGNDNAGGWGDSKSKANNSGGGWGGGSKAPSNHPSRTSHPKDNASTVCAPIIKPYWADWNKPDPNATTLRPKPRSPYEYPALPAPIGAKSNVSYGVQAGRGANYTHQTYRPEYLDSMQKPYAIFTFKYRSRAALERILKRKVDVGEVRQAVREAEMEGLMMRSKGELVEEMMRLRVKGGKGRSGAEKAKNEKEESWGKDAAGAGGGGWNDGGQDEVKPSDSASQWGGDDNQGEQNDQGAWGGDDNGGGGGGGDGWGADDKKSSSKKSKGGGGDGWGNGGDAGGGDAGWGDNDNKTEEHFAGDPGLQQTAW